MSSNSHYVAERAFRQRLDGLHYKVVYCPDPDRWYSQRLCAKASGVGLSQASEHETDHGDENPGFFTAGEHFIVFGEPAPGGEPGEGALDNPAVWKHLKAAGSDLFPIDHRILWSPDAS